LSSALRDSRPGQGSISQSAEHSRVSQPLPLALYCCISPQRILCAQHPPTITSFIGVSSSLGRHGQSHWAGARSPLTSHITPSPSPAEKQDPFAYMASSDDDNNKKSDYTVELGDRQPNGSFDAAPKPQAMASPTGPSITNSPPISILAYCGSSILMTVTNKYVLSSNFNLNFFLLAVQVCKPCKKRIRALQEQLG
jgi:hypothetical protein